MGLLQLVANDEALKDSIAMHAVRHWPWGQSGEDPLCALHRSSTCGIARARRKRLLVQMVLVFPTKTKHWSLTDLWRIVPYCTLFKITDACRLWPLRLWVLPGEAHLSAAGGRDAHQRGLQKRCKGAPAKGQTCAFRCVQRFSWSSRERRWGTNHWETGLRETFHVFLLLIIVCWGWKLLALDAHLLLQQGGRHCLAWEPTRTWESIDLDWRVCTDAFSCLWNPVLIKALSPESTGVRGIIRQENLAFAIWIIWIFLCATHASSA